MEEPKFDLAKVFKLTKSGQTKLGFPRAICAVMETLNLDTEEATNFIIKEILGLTKDNFNTRTLIDGLVYDIYGKIIKSIPWYIKFSIVNNEGDEFLWNISFHPIEKNLETRIATLLFISGEKDDE